MSRLTEETRFESKPVDVGALLNCVRCDAIFWWGSGKIPGADVDIPFPQPRFCPSCGRRNSEAP